MYPQQAIHVKNNKRRRELCNSIIISSTDPLNSYFPVLFYIKSPDKRINGKEPYVTVNDGEVRINGAKILAKDRQGSNGVVHSIDIVNLPAV